MQNIAGIIGRFFEELRPVADTQAICANEVSHQELQARQRLKKEYSQLFEADLRQASRVASVAHHR